MEKQKYPSYPGTLDIVNLTKITGLHFTIWITIGLLFQILYLKISCFIQCVSCHFFVIICEIYL